MEDWVPADHPARFLREFVDQLDLPALGFASPDAAQGRPPYEPSLLLKIWLYGYFQRIRSTRQLEVACREQLGLLRLTGLIQPDHNSLWRFWRDNRTALRAVFQQTVQLALRTGAVGLVLQAHDNIKIEAAASGYSGWNKAYMEKLLVQRDAALALTEESIAQAAPDQPGYRLPDTLAQRQALREQIQAGLAQLADDSRQHYHPVEPDARRMKVGSTNRYAYNAQAAAAGLSVLAAPAQGTPVKDHPYAVQHFHYDEQARTVTCPQQRRLDYEGQTHKDGVAVQRYRCHIRDCRVRDQCTRDPKGRQFEVRPATAVVQAMRAQLQEPETRALWCQRSQIIEPRFAQLKAHDRFRRWSVRGLAGVQTQ